LAVVSSPWPAYLGLGSAEVAARAESARRLLGPGRCGICPRLCKVNRLGDQRGLCAIGRQAAVVSHFPAFRRGELPSRPERLRPDLLELQPAVRVLPEP
jgi:hypothetical protein